jgi:hypothetical protein
MKILKLVLALTTVSIRYKSQLIKIDICIAFRDFSILKFKTKYDKYCRLIIINNIENLQSSIGNDC